MRTAQGCSFTVLFAAPRAGKLEIVNGGPASLEDFHAALRLEVHCREANLSIGSFATVASVRISAPQATGFSFSLRDISSEYPIFLPDFGAAVIPADDPRDYAEVARDVSARGLADDFRRLEAIATRLPE